jgi:hypothetical protein
MLSTFAYEAAGTPTYPAFPAPSDLRGPNVEGKTRAPARRGREAVSTDGAVCNDGVTAGLSHLERTWPAVLLRPSFETPAFGRAPQDEALLRGEILDPHGEEPARSGRLEPLRSNRLTFFEEPYAIPLGDTGTNFARPMGI